MATVVTIGGSTVANPRPVVLRRVTTWAHRGVPSAEFEVRGGALPTGADPYLGKEITVTAGGTLVFTGDVVSVAPAFGAGLGWVRKYHCLGLKHRGDRAPHTDSNLLGDSSAYNVPRDNQPDDYLASRSGRTVGQILTDVLTMQANAVALDALGIGGYTGLPTAPALPAATVADLAGMTRVPLQSVKFGGERLLAALESFTSQHLPNHTFWVKPDGTLRWTDLRTVTQHTFTTGPDCHPTAFHRDLTECAPRVVVRGQTVAEMRWFGLLWGTLDETPFAHDALSVSAAKVAWRSSDFFTPKSLDEGTCTCPNTTTVTVTSADAARIWASNFWDQTSTGRHGVIFLTYLAGSGITMQYQGLVTANASLSAAGTSALTVDPPLPHLNFNRYGLRGTHGGAESVWCEYALPSWAQPLLRRQSTYPFAFRFGGGAAETLTSTPMGSVLWSSSGSAPFWESSVAVVVDPDAGTVRFGRPTYLTAGNRAPSDVRALVPISTAENTATYPPDSGGPVYSGTSNSVDAQTNTLTVTVPSWRDPANASAALDYATDLHASVKDTHVEGSVALNGLVAAVLWPGVGVSLDAAGYTTGLESANVPVVECAIEYGTSPNAPLDYTTTVRCSNRRAHFGADAFLHPDRTGVSFDFGGGLLDLSGFAGAVPDYSGVQASGIAGAQGLANSFGGGTADLAGQSAAAAALSGGVGNNLAGTGRDDVHRPDRPGSDAAEKAAMLADANKWADWNPLEAAMPEPTGGSGGES